jgi:uncharacterized protein YdeI (YjbR/CyaY-like superfamily)
MVHVILFLDEDPLHIPDEKLACLQEEPNAMNFFTPAEDEQEHYLRWIYSAKKNRTDRRNNRPSASRFKAAQ